MTVERLALLVTLLAVAAAGTMFEEEEEPDIGEEGRKFVRSGTAEFHQEIQLMFEFMFAQELGSTYSTFPARAVIIHITNSRGC